MTNDKIEYLESLHKTQDAHNLMIQGVNMIVESGAEGIKIVAEEAPEVIISAIVGLMSVIDVMQKEHLALVENYLELADAIESCIPDE